MKSPVIGTLFLSKKKEIELSNSNTLLITKMEPTSLLHDFNVFIYYLEEKQFPLTAKRETLDRKSLYEMNKSMIEHEPISVPNYDQRFYPLLDLFYNLSP